MLKEKNHNLYTNPKSDTSKSDTNPKSDTPTSHYNKQNSVAKRDLPNYTSSNKQPQAAEQYLPKYTLPNKRTHAAERYLPNYTSSSDKMKVLIVVDVQNCFIDGGSMLATDPNKYNKMCKEILEHILQTNYNLVVFSRDFHPENHINFKKVGGIFNSHCRNINRTCNNKITDLNQAAAEQYKKERSYHLNGNINIDSNDINKKEIIGTNLSYHFYNNIEFTDILDSLNDINNKNTIGLIKDEPTNTKKLHLKDPQINNINLDVTELELNKTKIIGLTKGEYCIYESYSAFNYHIKNNTEELKQEQDYSTGLWEYILKKNSSKTIEINVCGLVTNFCVKDTAIQGLKMWNNVYNKLQNKNTNTNTSKLKIIKNIKLPTNVTFNVLEYLSLPLYQDNSIPLLYFPFTINIHINTSNNNEQQLATKKLFDVLNDDEKQKINIYTDNKTNIKLYDSSQKKGGSGHSNNCNCQSCNEYYRVKYLKYKQKYLQYKNNY